MGSERIIQIAKKGRAALAKWRRSNPDALLNLSDADLQDADLRGANLKRADLTGADLRGADLVGAQLGDADLTRADLRGARLVKADAYSARLFKATLREAECAGAYFRRADLTQVDFTDADLTKADLIEANLKNGNLNSASIVGADLSRARLSGVDMRQTVMGWTVLGALDLSQIVGLDQVRHVGPSTLGFDTALRSRKSLSKQFLQGCGITEGVLQNWDSMFGHPVEDFPCFIRYAPDDESFAKHFYNQSQEKGMRCWMDGLPARSKDRKNRSSPTAFESNERVFLCASKASLTSWWIEDEIERVFEREKRLKEDTGRDVRLFFPINLDGFMFSGDWKHKKEKQISKITTDFVGWRRNQEKFDQELGKLVQIMIGEKK